MQDIQLAAGRVVRLVLAEGRNLNQVLEDELARKTGWSPSQRAALQDFSYGTLRFYGQLHAVLGMLLHKPLPDERVNCLLLVALYQLSHSRAAPYAIVDHAVRASRKLNPRVSGLVNAVLRNFLRNQANLQRQASESEEGKFAYPQWWIDELRAQYGPHSADILEAGNRHPLMTLRVNRLRGSTAAYRELLAEQGAAARQTGPDALLLEKPLAVDKLPGFIAGLASVQDAGAQCAARLLDLRDGQRVLDVCAAPGGKTAHILESAAVQLVAVDKDEKRLKRVAENLQRLGLHAQLVAGDASQPLDWWDGQPFERILADVPCSASGVVRRHPDIKWLRRRADLDKFAAQQLEILRAIWRLLAQDGKLLYSTCSVFRQENEQVIAAFLALQPDAQRLPVGLPDNSEGQLLPNDWHDGFYYALLQKSA